MASGAESLKRFANDEQDPAIVAAVHGKVSSILTSGEEVLYIAVQKKPLMNFKPECVILTNKRFIIYRPSLLGGASFEDHVWRDLHDAKLRETMLGAVLSLQTVGGKTLGLDYLPKAHGRRLYALAHEMEEKVREERRSRDLEDKRAAAGGIVMHSPPPPTPPPQLRRPTLWRSCKGSRRWLTQD